MRLVLNKVGFTENLLSYTEAHADSKSNIDRVLLGVKYGSGKYMKILANRVVEDKFDAFVMVNATSIESTVYFGAGYFDFLDLIRVTKTVDNGILSNINIEIVRIGEYV